MRQQDYANQNAGFDCLICNGIVTLVYLWRDVADARLQ